jgi:hypothetical protein
MSAISSSTVSLRIFSKHLQPDEITQQLGFPPTEAAKTGEKKAKPKGGTRVIRQGFWFLNYGENDSVLLEDKIVGLLENLTDELDIWKKITDEYTTDIFCGVFMDNWNEGFGLSPACMKKLAERNLKIGFDIYQS